MPSINVAMERSLREGLSNLLLASLRPALEGRDGTLTSIGNGITDAKTAFSSWDNCMNAVFCKWPVIAIIIIGGLIIFSVVWCIIRCACCGVSCCCSCFHCLKCCGDCCGCCDPPRGKNHKYLDAPYIPPDQGYKSAAPMTVGPPAPAVPTIAPTRSAPPQYAEFDVSKKGAGGHDEDALPAMPSWEGSSNKKVSTEGDAVEMDDLKKPETTGQNVPLMTGSASPGPASPGFMPPGFTPESRGVNQGPYGQQLAPDGYSQDPYRQAGQGYNQNGAYGQSQQSLAVDQNYGVVGAPMGPGRRSPRAYNEGGYGQQERGFGPPTRQGSFDQYGRSRQGSYDDYSQPRNPGMGPGPGPRRSPRPMQPNGFPQDPRARPPPGPQGEYGYSGERARASPAPQGDYGYNNNRPYGPSRNQSSESTQALVRPPPQRQYSQDMPPPQSPLQNAGGFDFNSGFSRPDTGYESREPTLPQLDHIPQKTQDQQGYPGYKPYQANNRQQQQGWN